MWLFYMQSHSSLKPLIPAHGIILGSELQQIIHQCIQSPGAQVCRKQTIKTSRKELLSIHLIIFHLLELDLIRWNFKTFIIQGKLNIYKVIIPSCYPTFCHAEIPPTWNRGQNQERSQQSSKQEKHNKVLPLKLHAQHVLWFLTQNLLSFLSTIQQVAMGSIFLLHGKYQIRKMS